MSHVDEGALHAYLDGALDEFPPAEAARIRSHLDECTDCAERLEVERRIRSDAHAVLGLAAPEVEVPSFEELRAYVKRTRQQKRGISRLQRMGWAASIAVALGAGWMLREGQLQSRAMDAARESVATPATDMAPAAAPVDRSVVAEQEASDDMPTTFADRSLDVDRDEVREAAAEGANPASVGSVGSEPGRQVVVAANESGARVAEAREPSAPGETASVRMEESVADPAGRPAVEAALAEDRVARSRADAVAASAPTADPDIAQTAAPAAVDVVAGLPAEPAADSGAAAGAGVAASAEEQLARRSRSADAVLTSAMSVTAERQPVAEVDKAAADDERPREPLLAVPGLEVLDVTNLGDGTTPWGARARQRTEDGRAFEVYHLEPGIDPSILPDPDEGVREARSETGYGWVIVRGPLSDEELDDFLGRLLR